jgi:hypothetical protein
MRLQSVTMWHLLRRYAAVSCLGHLQEDGACHQQRFADALESAHRSVAAQRLHRAHFLMVSGQDHLRRTYKPKKESKWPLQMIGWSDARADRSKQVDSTTSNHSGRYVWIGAHKNVQRKHGGAGRDGEQVGLSEKTACVQTHGGIR